ncbi:DUF349 domain-containing protein [Aliikangiella sp. G2MR2-5]|uniref:DUF349 domain-containing protein n=1 Tax=Aliikangiella sp. G2MR2-5 TaxID=2788943 RepID=UPI0018A8FBD9|nr:DUF349 domain-containing protein [Aliikangiella sp. G2MR2-5]
MFSKLFTPKWQHQDHQVRQAAVNALNVKEHESILLQVAVEDDCAPIRKLALSKIDRLQPLKNLLEKADTVEQWLTLANRAIEIDPGYCESLSMRLQRQFIESLDEVKLLLIANTGNPDLIKPILPNLAEGLLVTLVSGAKSFELKLAALEYIQELPRLQELAKLSSHKQVIKQIKAQINRVKSVKEKQQQEMELAQSICSQLEKLASSHWDSQSNAKYHLLEARWNSLSPKTQESLQLCFSQSLSACQKCEKKNRERIEKELLAQEASVNAREVIHQLHNIFEEMKTETLANIDSQIEAFQLLKKTWLQLSLQVELDAELKGQFGSLEHDIERIISVWNQFDDNVEQMKQHFALIPQIAIEKDSELADELIEFASNWLKKWNLLIHDLAWPDEIPMPEQLNLWLNEVKKLENEVDEYLSEELKKINHLKHKINQLKNQIKRKNLIAANKIFNYVNYEKAHLTKTLNSPIDKMLEGVIPLLDELRDWHAFATQPKKQALCDAMKSLTRNDVEPLELAEKIHQLQEEWHELTSSDSNADSILWDEFKEAADKAYEPCHKYYLEQDKVRADNLRKRQSVCLLIEKFIKESSLISQKNVEQEKSDKDWRELDKKYSQWIVEWKSYQPIPVNEQKRIQKRFNQLIERIKIPLNNYKQGNLEARERLVKKAQSLNEVEEVSQAVDAAKNLQNQWKALGMTFYRADKKQWQLFRNELDKVFARRDLAKKQFLSQLDENRQLISELTKKIEQLAELSAPEILAARGEFDRLSAQWQTNLKLPRKEEKALINAFDSARKHFSRSCQLAKRQVEQQKIVNFIDLLLAANQIKLSDLAGEAQDIDGFLLQIEGDDTDYLCEELGASLVESGEKRVASSEFVEDVQTRLLDAEILFELTSSPEIKAKRMARQLALLEKGNIGLKATVKPKKWNDDFAKFLISGLPVDQNTLIAICKRWQKIIAEII